MDVIRIGSKLQMRYGTRNACQNLGAAQPAMPFGFWLCQRQLSVHIA
jgi:hypothetical protein